MKHTIENSGTQQHRRMMMPREARRVGRKLLTQQCWCWGQDVKCEAGNLLIQYGFSRQRPPEGESGATAYSLKLLPNAHISLWGFGLFYGEVERGGVFIGRFNFEARYRANWELPRPIWLPPQIDEFVRVPSTRDERSTSRALLSNAILWMQRYEHWVLEKQGLEYRCRCLEKFPQAIAPDVAAQTWKSLSQAVLAARLTTTSNREYSYALSL